MKVLGRRFFARSTETVARDLLGKVLLRRGEGASLCARIVEVEAYLGLMDKASHARRGPTPRAAIMFGPPGHLYTYLIYGMHVCANLVTEKNGTAGAVLLRAAAVDGVDPHWLKGPGKLCKGLGIRREHNGLDVTRHGSELCVLDDGETPAIATSARVGVDYAQEWAKAPLRFFVPGHPAVSGPRSAARSSTSASVARAERGPLARPGTRHS